VGQWQQQSGRTVTAASWVKGMGPLASACTEREKIVEKEKSFI